MSGHMDKSQGFTLLYASFYPSIFVGVPVTFNQTGETKNMSFEHDSFESYQKSNVKTLYRATWLRPLIKLNSPKSVSNLLRSTVHSISVISDGIHNSKSGIIFFSMR